MCLVGDLTGLKSIPASPFDSRGGVLGRAGPSNAKDVVPFMLDFDAALGGFGVRCSLAPNVNAGATEVEGALVPNSDVEVPPAGVEVVEGVPKLNAAVRF